MKTAVKPKKTRKSRSKEVKKDPDFSKPIIFDLSKIGTDEDCFGVMHDLTADECNKCGDCELCSIVYSQRAHAKRAKQEEKFVAKDLEEEKLTGDHPQIREFILKTLKESKVPVRLKTLIDTINTRLYPNSKKDSDFLKQVIKNFNIFRIYKKDKKVYLKLNIK